LIAIPEEPDEDDDYDELLSKIHTLKEQINIPEPPLKTPPKIKTLSTRKGVTISRANSTALHTNSLPMRVMYDRLISDNEFLKEERAILAQENMGLKVETIGLKQENVGLKVENMMLTGEVMDSKQEKRVVVWRRSGN
jgi:hypothetical protein